MDIDSLLTIVRKNERWGFRFDEETFLEFVGLILMKLQDFIFNWNKKSCSWGRIFCLETTDFWTL